MKQYEYSIYETVYDDIMSGKKTIEFRLLNEKSVSISIGDLIKFNVIDDDKKSVLVEVIDKYIYDNVGELWDSGDILCNTTCQNKDELIYAFNEIFGKDNVNNSKIVGIKFKIKQ